MVLYLFKHKTTWYVCFLRGSLQCVNLLHPVKLPQSWLGTRLCFTFRQHTFSSQKLYSVTILKMISGLASHLFFSVTCIKMLLGLDPHFGWHWNFLRNRAETSLTQLERKINLPKLRVLVFFARISIPRKSFNQKYGF